MNKDFQGLTLMVDGRTVVFPCVEIMALSATSKADGASGYVRFYEAFSRKYGGAVKHYRLNDSTRWKVFQPKDHHKVPSWFSDARSLREPLLGVTIHTNDKADDPQPPLFKMFFDHAWPQYPRGMFRIVLPLDTVKSGASDLLQLVDDAMHEFPVHWGTAGFSFYWEGNDTTIEKYAEQWLGRHLTKHPGLAMGNEMRWGTIVEKGIASIGWLTFVGDTLVDKLGGRDALAERLTGTGIGLRSYEKGVALQAGDAPELGNVNRKDTLPLYREVGAVLDPVIAPQSILENIRVTGIKDPDARLAWLRRFLP